MHSRILGDLLFSKVEEVKSLFYPSVIQEGGMNLAINPCIADNSLELDYSAVIYIKNKFKFGMYDINKIKDCIAIGMDHLFIWQESESDRVWKKLKGHWSGAS